jgi:hypothetical protein
MKVFMIIACVLVLVFIIFQIYVTMSTNKTETQAYTLIKATDSFEIRYYPTATMAMIRSTATSYRDLGSSGFGKLAKFIFGGNSEKKQIAMTSPVHMNISDSGSTMAFVLPAGYNTANLPKPNDTSIAITTAPAEYVAVTSFGGFANNETITKHSLLLQQALQAKGIAYYGNIRFLGYNPPYQLFGRRNEVIVAVHWDGK